MDVFADTLAEIHALPTAPPPQHARALECRIEGMQRIIKQLRGRVHHQLAELVAWRDHLRTLRADQ